RRTATGRDPDRSLGRCDDGRVRAGRTASAQLSVEMVNDLVHAWLSPLLRGRTPTRRRLTRGLPRALALATLDKRREQDTRLVEHIQWDGLQQQRDCVSRQERGDGRAH